MAIHPIHGYAIKPPQDLKTIKRNERERNRVETVNRGFETLRMHVPTAAPVKKMSKVNILNQALDYIVYLQQILEQTSESPSWEHHQYQYHHQQQNHSFHQSLNSSTSSAASPMTSISSPITSGNHNDSSNHGYYSDTSIHSPPSFSRSSSWTSPEALKASSWKSPVSYQDYYGRVPIKQETSAMPDSTTEGSDEDEDEVLDAIAEWQKL